MSKIFSKIYLKFDLKCFHSIVFRVLLFIYLKLFYIFNIKFNFNKNLMVSMIYFKIILLFNFKHYNFFLLSLSISIFIYY